MAKILQQEGFIQSYDVVQSSPQSVLHIDLKYTKERHPQFVISGLRRISKPGRRIYTKSNGIPWVRSGLGIAVLSTPTGVITDREARRLRVGGEILCYVW